MAHVARHNDHASSLPADAQAKLEELIRVGAGVRLGKLARTLGTTETTLDRLVGGGVAMNKTVERIAAALRRIP